MAEETDGCRASGWDSIDVLGTCSFKSWEERRVMPLMGTNQLTGLTLMQLR